MCTRLVKRATISKRMWQIFDQGLPYELQLLVQKQAPNEKQRFGIGTALFVITSYEFQKTKVYRYATLEEAETRKKMIEEGTGCLRCKKHPRDCTKRVFRKWD